MTGARLSLDAPAGVFRGVSGLLSMQARRRPRAPALRTHGQALSYGELNTAVHRGARYWQSQGIAPGDVIGLQLANRIDTIVHELALARLGATAALLAPDLSASALHHALAVCNAVGLIGLDGSTPLGSKYRYWSMEKISSDLHATSAAPIADPWIGHDAIFCYLFTSGTTGLPKAAPVRHRRFLAGGYAFQSLALGLRPREALFTPLPFHHASAQVIGLSSVLWAGATFAFVPHFSARRYWADAHELGAVAGLYIGELCRYLLDDPAAPTDREHQLRVLVGNGLQADVWAAFQARFGVDRIIEFYGATEGNAVLLNRNGKVGSCGRPVFPGLLDNLRLVEYDPDSESLKRDPQGRLLPVPPGMPGELIARIMGIPGQGFDGYADAHATAAKIVQDGRGPGSRWFRTGDLLRRDADGDFFFVDRIGDTFRWKGENVSTDEVAQRVRGASGIDDVVVYGVELPGHEGRAGMAAVTGDAFAPHAVFAAVQSLPKHARPVFIREIQKIERTETHKIRRAPLRSAGIDPVKCCGDPIWVRDDQAATYTPLTPRRREQIRTGILRV